MKNKFMIKDLFKCINKSNFIIIGYDSNREFVKDLILDKLNPYHINDYVNFNRKQFTRDSRLNHILNDTEIIDTNFFHIDIETVPLTKSVDIKPESTINSLDKNIRLNKIIEDIRFNLNISDILIVTTNTYKSAG
jgi:hypothetical protein